MKTSTFPSLRVEPELREAIESVPRESETPTALVVHNEFMARGLRSGEDAALWPLPLGEERSR
jgi:hypothetical protein